MPVNDDLLARADEVLNREHVNVWTPREAAMAKVLRQLRAALAARPQPLFEGTVDDAWVQDRGTVVVVAKIAPVPEELDGHRVVVYPAVAGSATPTQENDDV